ncbi:hypothetical protein [Paenibacillus sp. GCM10012303]|uniref:hypothetical protein n=1 Tax=Paenibacillus sp. GCM10012303 TaxID=3317340 RepID=UPI0036112FD6
MNIQWQLPDNRTWETNVPSINQLLFALEVVDAVSIQGVSYQTVQKQLVVQDDHIYVAVSLVHRMAEGH